jgi:predicted SnoaL-like aldol condensation-catalyzing enzyme
MATETNKAIIRHLFEEALTKGNLHVIDELFASGYIEHQYALAPTSPKQFFTLLQSTLAAIHLVVEDLEQDKVVARWTTHPKNADVPSRASPIGIQAIWTGINIYRLADGKVVEHWGNIDNLDLPHAY